MPWVRIDENAMDHPKIGTLPDGSFRLWVQGLAYCQKHLTDGFIADPFVRALPAFSPKRRVVLVDAGLWHDVTGGIAVHDYLQWNDSKADVSGKRQAARDRMRRSRERSQERDGERSPHVLRGVRGDTGTEQPFKKTEGGQGETKPDAARVARFVERYRDLHEQIVGVAYLGNPQKDYWAACELAAAFDDEMLEKIAVFGLHDGDAFMSNGTRTITKLKSRASDYAQHLKAKRLA